MPEPLSAALARLHRAAFGPGAAWSADELAALMAQPGALLVHRGAGFALGRAAAGEAELITLAVAPEARRQGLGAALLLAIEGRAARAGAGEMFLEVAEDNAPARALYARAGWHQVGARPGYYARPRGLRADALILRKRLDAAGEGA